MKKVKIILGSTRTNRAGEKVANWVNKRAAEYSGNISFEFIDLKVINLPFIDEPVSPMATNGDYAHEHTKQWSKIIDDADGFLIITPEYNHGYPAVLKNAIDFLYKEWEGKPVGIVGYGGSGARSSIRQLREILEFVKMKPLEDQVGIGEIWAAFDEEGVLDESKVRGDLMDIFKQLDETLNK